MTRLARVGVHRPVQVVRTSKKHVPHQTPPHFSRITTSMTEGTDLIMPRAHCCLLPCLPCCQQQDELVALPYELTSVQPAPEPGPTTTPRKPAPKPDPNSEEQHQHQNQYQNHHQQDVETRLTLEQIVAAVPTEQQLQEQQKKQEEQDKQDPETRLAHEAIVATVPRSSNGSESSLTAIEASVEPTNENESEHTKDVDDAHRRSAPPNLDGVQIPKDRLPDFSLTSQTRISYYGPPPFPPPLRPLPALPSHQYAYATGQQNDKAGRLDGSKQSSRSD